MPTSDDDERLHPGGFDQKRQAHGRIVRLLGQESA